MGSSLQYFYNQALGDAVTKGPQTPLLSAEATARPVHLVTGVSFTPYDPATYGVEETQAIFENDRGEKYLMNTGAATITRLLDAGEQIIMHGSAPDMIARALGNRYDANTMAISGGDLTTADATQQLVRTLKDFAATHAVSEVRIMAYQSFAQNGNQPFKPMHEEAVCEVERAATRRIRFAFNMAAIGYWLLDAEKQADLRVVVMSALAANRPSFGLVADAADKFMNENVWRTFHLEANHLTQKPVSIIQINSGITTACGVYQGNAMRHFLMEEAKADGHPMDAQLNQSSTPLPQLSAHDVGDVAYRMLTAAPGSDTNINLPPTVQNALFGGYSPEALRAIFNRVVKDLGDRIEIGVDQPGPQHLYAAYTTYGRLPAVEPGKYQRISLTPPGQTF